MGRKVNEASAVCAIVQKQCVAHVADVAGGNSSYGDSSIAYGGRGRGTLRLLP